MQYATEYKTGLSRQYGFSGFNEDVLVQKDETFRETKAGMSITDAIH